MMSSMFKRNQRLLIAGLAAVAALAVAFARSGSSHAQSGSRLPAAQSAVALEGYCPVCIIEMKKWVRGSAAYATAYDGKTYLFPGDQQKQMFLADPAKYVPALGGDCTVCFAKLNQRIPGNVRYASLHHNRLFLFPSEDQKKEFMAHPDQYTNADLALDGKCAVCRVEMNQDVPGKPEIAAQHQGLRYLFPSDEQRKMFLANPAKYAVQPTAVKQAAIGAAARQIVTITGKSGCAGCDHGVVPIGSPSELGLAVNATDGRVYVVEDAHKLYPKVYEARFAGMPVEVSGTVLKRDGKISWIQPTQLKVLN